MSQSTEDFYKRLKEELEKTTEKWPAEYLYKFIVPAKEENVAFIESTFNNMGAIIKTKKSKKGNYISISVNVIMKSARSEEHTSELQSRPHLVCRLLLE